MENSDFHFTMLSWVISQFEVDSTFLFLLLAVDIAAKVVGCSWMCKKWLDIISTISYRLFVDFEISNKTGRLLRYFDKKYFIDRSSWGMWFGLTVGIVAERYAAGNFFIDIV